KPVIVDAGVETYTAKTFSSTRYELWTMQSAYHSLPTVNGVQQSAGRDFAASNVFYSAGDDQADFVLDIAGAYPEEAGIKSWTRTVCLVRDEEVIVTDRFDLRAAMGETSMHLMTPCNVNVEDGELVLQETTFGRDRVSGSAKVVYDEATFDERVEIVAITDDKLGGLWGDHLNRIVFEAKEMTLHGEWQLRIAR
ncbi:MAG: heparinase II/III family protein, partial [Candidatus Latescibacteria bacterium]|nr:heparinase II/III family protein [Candidatus Latescibacterota bacterium]